MYISASNINPDTAMPSSTLEPYSIENLMMDWETYTSRFSKPWGLMKISTGLQFLSISRSEASAWRGVLVSDDMSVQVNYYSCIY